MKAASASILAIPQTSPTRYISGIVALNIPSESGTGDWHQSSIFFVPRLKTPGSFIIELGQPFDPSELLGGVGIYDASPVLDSMRINHPEGPVYAASHARAIADLVIISLLRGTYPDHIDLDEWMPQDNDKAAVFALLRRASQKCDNKIVDALNKWINTNTLESN